MGRIQRAALQQEPSYRVRGTLTDGFDSTTKSMRTLFPGSTPGQLPPPRAQQAPRKAGGVSRSGPPRVARQVPCPVVQVSPAQSLAGVCAGPTAPPLRRSRHATLDKSQRGARAALVRAKKAGWYAVLADPKMPASSTLLDQAHNAIERKLFMMKGFHHPAGSQPAFLTGLAHLYNLIPYQRRALHAGQCGVEVEGGRVPTSDWMLNLQILTSGGFR